MNFKQQNYKKNIHIARHVNIYDDFTILLVPCNKLCIISPFLNIKKDFKKQNYKKNVLKKPFWHLKWLYDFTSAVQQIVYRITFS